MPSGRDSFRRNRVAPSVQLHFSTTAQLPESWLTITPPRPLFFVSVAAKGLGDPVSFLFATLTGDFISVDSK